MDKEEELGRQRAAGRQSTLWKNSWHMKRKDGGV